MSTRNVTLALVALFAGLAVALALARSAAAYTPDQLPNMGYSVSMSNLGNNCHGWTVSGYGASADLGSDCDAGFQAALDAFLARTYPPLQTTATTVTAPAATTAIDTTTTTAVATTAPVAPPAPAPVAPSDPVATTPTATVQTTDTTVAAPTAPAPDTTTAPAAAAPTASTDTTISDLQAQLDQLRAQISALALRVTAVENYLAAGGFITDTVSSAYADQQASLAAP